MSKRKLKLVSWHTGVAGDDSDKATEVHLFFNRPLSQLEFLGVVAAVERTLQ